MGSVDIDIRLQHMSRDYCDDINDQRFPSGMESSGESQFKCCGYSTVRYKCYLNLT